MMRESRGHGDSGECVGDSRVTQILVVIIKIVCR